MERMTKEKKADQNAVAKLTREWLYKENKWLLEENRKLKEKVETLELWLDRKEKLNEKYRKELKNYVYDAKQVRDIC